MDKYARWDYLIITEEGEVSGTNNEQDARDMAKEGTLVIHVNEKAEVAVADSDFEPVEITSL